MEISLLNILKNLTGEFRTDDLNEQEVSDYTARLGKYRRNHALINGGLGNGAYNWRETMLQDYDLYRFLRSYIVGSRLTSFYSDLIWQAPLSFCTTGEDLASVVWNQQWRGQRDQTVADAAAYGDFFLRVVDEVDSVYLKPVSPFHIHQLEKNGQGNVTFYEFTKKYEDERGTVHTYSETARQTENGTVFTTYRDGQQFAYGGGSPTWMEPYDVPLAHAQFLGDNTNIFGRAIVDPISDPLLSLNEIWSFLVDRLRRQDPVLLAQAPQKTLEALEMVEPEHRDEVRAILIPTAPAEEVKNNLEYVAPQSFIQDILAVTEQLYHQIKETTPALALLELQYGWETGNPPSGRALELAREPVIKHVHRIRSRLDPALEYATNVAGQIMALRGLGSFNEPVTLEKTRPVFVNDRQQELELDATLWETAVSVVEAGGDLGAFLRRNGYSEEEVAEIVKPNSGDDSRNQNTEV